MSEEEDYIKRVERAELIRESKPIPESHMTEHELDIALEKKLKEDKERGKGRRLN